ncbi:MAG: metallophosphoesterase family protein [Gemmatimonadota bacterium]|jgi:putative phosphoesterase|nr:MAG: metallophosphoesterase family protein [Gemmatimonadota bacterium]
MDEGCDRTRHGRPLAGDRWLVGVISDTHGLLRPEVFEAFSGVSHILHAGDIGETRILEELSALAPVTAVWGNMDDLAIRGMTKEVQRIDLAGTAIAVIHGHQYADYSALPSRFPEARVIVHGHTHRPFRRRISGTLVLNPGSAGPRRPGAPVTVALLRIGKGDPRARHVHL